LRELETAQAGGGRADAAAAAVFEIENAGEAEAECALAGDWTAARLACRVPGGIAPIHRQNAGQHGIDPDFSAQLWWAGGNHRRGEEPAGERGKGPPGQSHDRWRGLQ